MSQEQYENVYREKFNQIIGVQAKQGNDIGEIREKLFNGIDKSSAMIPDIQTGLARVEVKVDTLMKHREKAPKAIAKQRGFEVAIMGVIVAAVAQWDSIAAFISRLF